MINPSIIEDLGEDIFRQATVIFLRNCELDINSLELAFSSNNLDDIASMSHKLIGTFGSMRVEQMPALLREINEATEEAKIEEEVFEEVKEFYEELKIYIKDNFSIETEA
ncbi:Hpt domain-containing protein [Flavobacteriales bacterium]|nr:Hpt domain-containing protein [Flavobacteriales bacterium]